MSETAYFSGPNKKAWIGLNALRVRYLFEWSDNQPVTFTNWMVGEPNNARDKEDCVIMYNVSHNFTLNVRVLQRCCGNKRSLRLVDGTIFYIRVKSTTLWFLPFLSRTLGKWVVTKVCRVSLARENA